MWTEQSQYDRYIYTLTTTATQRTNIKKYKGYGKLYIKLLFITSAGGTSNMYIPCILTDDVFQSTPVGSILASYSLSGTAGMNIQIVMRDDIPAVYTTIGGTSRADFVTNTFRWKLIGID